MENEELRMRLMEGSDSPDTVEAEPDADNRRASDLLEAISREAQEVFVREEETLDSDEEKERTGGVVFLWNRSTSAPSANGRC